MPRTLLSHRNYDKGLVKKIILKRLIDVGLDKRDLSEAINMPYRTFSHKLETGFWSSEELFEIFNETQMPQESILECFGRKESR